MAHVRMRRTRFFQRRVRSRAPALYRLGNRNGFTQLGDILDDWLRQDAERWEEFPRAVAAVGRLEPAPYRI